MPYVLIFSAVLLLSILSFDTQSKTHHHKTKIDEHTSREIR